jgi:hypothetical protein
MRTITVEERRARLARRHLLLPGLRTDDLPAIADSLVALHSSDPVTVFLSAWARMQVPSVEALEKALYDDRSLLRHHGMRRTLWVGSPDVVRQVHAAVTRRLVGRERRRTLGLLAANGVDDPQAWLDDARARVLLTLREHGPMPARTLGQRVPALRQPIVMAPGKPYSATVSAHTRVLLELGFEGVLVRTRPTGTWVNGQYTWAAADAWVDGGIESDLTEREAARTLADRWLRAFGPATTTDLQWWAGWTASVTRRALEDCGATPVLLETGDGEGPQPGWVAAGDDGPEEPVGPWVALLPGLDPTTMGWKQRDWYLPDACAEVFDRMGNAGPSVWADGRVVGAWAQRPDGEIRTHFLVDVPAATRAAVAERATWLQALLGETRFTVRFPGRIQPVLLG